MRPPLIQNRPTPEDYALRAVNHTIGNHGLCAWLVAPGVCWVQTRDPKHYERLRKRADARLVAVGVFGGYLRTFQISKSLSWAKRLIQRYQADKPAAGTGMKERDSACVMSKSTGQVKRATREQGTRAADKVWRNETTARAPATLTLP